MIIKLEYSTLVDLVTLSAMVRDTDQSIGLTGDIECDRMEWDKILDAVDHPDYWAAASILREGPHTLQDPRIGRELLVAVIQAAASQVQRMRPAACRVKAALFLERVARSFYAYACEEYLNVDYQKARRTAVHYLSQDPTLRDLPRDILEDFWI